MGELINGRTPEEINERAATCITSTCSECPYDRTEYFCDATDVMDNLLAYAQHLEAKQPKWISVEERLPEEVCRCLVITKRHEESSMVNTATYNHMGWWTHGNFGEITHWMPMPEPKKEDT